MTIYAIDPARNGANNDDCATANFLATTIVTSLTLRYLSNSPFGGYVKCMQLAHACSTMSWIVRWKYYTIYISINYLQILCSLKHFKAWILAHQTASMFMFSWRLKCQMPHWNGLIPRGYACKARPPNFTFNLVGSACWNLSNKFEFVPQNL